MRRLQVPCPLSLRIGRCLGLLGAVRQGSFLLLRPFLSSPRPPKSWCLLAWFFDYANVTLKILLSFIRSTILLRTRDNSLKIPPRRESVVSPFPEGERGKNKEEDANLERKLYIDIRQVIGAKNPKCCGGKDSRMMNFQSLIRIIATIRGYRKGHKPPQTAPS